MPIPHKPVQVYRHSMGAQLESTACSLARVTKRPTAMGAPMRSALTPQAVFVRTSRVMVQHVASVVWLASYRPGTLGIQTLRPRHVHSSSRSPTLDPLLDRMTWNSKIPNLTITAHSFVIPILNPLTNQTTWNSEVPDCFTIMAHSFVIEEPNSQSIHLLSLG